MSYSNIYRFLDKFYLSVKERCNKSIREGSCVIKNVSLGCYSIVTLIEGGVMHDFKRCYGNVTRIKGDVTIVLNGC